MLYHLYDGNNWKPYETLAEAFDAATYAISIARDCCDPYWPDWVNHIEIVFSDLNPKDDLELFEDTAVTIAVTDEKETTDYLTDYEMVLYGY